MPDRMKISVGLSLVISCAGAVAEDSIDFRLHIEPILRENCLECHGPEEQESDFRVDRKSTLLGGGGSGIETIIPGDPAQSYLIELVRESDEAYRMPYEREALPEEKILQLEKWIAEGAEIPDDPEGDPEVKKTDHWSLLPVVRPGIPAKPIVGSPIDAFLVEKLADMGLTYNPAADSRSLLRRTSILLTGLPPTPEQIDAFSLAHAKDADAAFLALVDRLLASPHFGERWAQHWLDVIRWAETNGSEANLYRKNAWQYRDYVIRAFNEDRPYHHFIREQLAGDQLSAGNATGFLVAGPHVPTATVGREPSAIRQARADRLDEIVQTVGASMLGMTVSCARCHNHKFDPISIKDYYSLSAIFQGVEFGSRYAELEAGNPRRIREGELRRSLHQLRQVLRADGIAWEEDWKGWKEMYFPATNANAIRLTFLSKKVRIEEIELYGPDDPSENLALSSRGTVAKTDDSMTEIRGEVFYANDGTLNTNVWRSTSPPESEKQPRIILEFSEPRLIDRMVISSNKHYFLETDYLANYMSYGFSDYLVEALGPDGTWQKLASTTRIRQSLEGDSALSTAVSRIGNIIHKLGEEGIKPSFVGQFIEPAVTHILHRGSPESPRNVVDPAGFAILNGNLNLDSSSPDGERRMRFADWLIDPDHPLTARVLVNRVWNHIFGRGIVATPADFGSVGAPPTHPELLDWLAREFVQPEKSGATPWSIKGLIRQILLTDAYRQSSAPREDGLALDASSRYLWRFPPRRVEAEVLRDGILRASGKLDPTLGGPSYRIHNEKKTYAQWEVVDNHGPGTWRRMIYQERMRRVDDQIFTAFDFPDCGQIRAKRPISTTPLQALNLLNSPFAMEQAGFIAERAKAETSGGALDATKRIFDLLLGRDPSEIELDASLAVAQNGGLHLVSRSLMNSNEFAFLP